MAEKHQMEGPELRVLVFDRDENGGRWLGMVLDCTPGCEFAGLSKSPEGLEEMALKTRAQAVLMNLRDALAAETDLLAGLREVGPSLKIFLMDEEDRSVYHDQARRLGADGFVSKARLTEGLAELVRISNEQDR
jgi:DNA-binding NarL/FixJ family response regulator